MAQYCPQRAPLLSKRFACFPAVFHCCVSHFDKKISGGFHPILQSFLVRIQQCVFNVLVVFGRALQIVYV